jgi:beta-aspartyl-dipeptidase (metallo-type)
VFTLIERGEVYAPEPQGRQSLLISFDKIAQVGAVDRRLAEAMDAELEVLDASGCIIVPGFMDPHEHLLGGSGEEGFSTQTPPIELSEIVGAGITTVVGVLGVDTTMKTMAGLLAQVKGLKEEGLNAHLWSGGYTVPPTTITGSIRDDIMFIDEVIGLGEIAIADTRASDPTAKDLARAVTDAHVGGMLSRKAGRTHVHVGEGNLRLALLRELLDDPHYEIKVEWFYPTHIERSEALMDEAMALAKRGAFVDIDTVEQDTPKWLKYYVEQDGDLDQLTLSTDASLSSPRSLHAHSRSIACRLRGLLSEASVDRVN